MKQIGILILVIFFCLVTAAWPQLPEHPQPAIITFDAPGAGTTAGQGTQANKINPWGEIVGWFLDTNNVFHSFIRSLNGKIAVYDSPGAGTGSYQGSGAWSVNVTGAIAGDFVDANCLEHGYLRQPDGRFIIFEAPGAGTIPGPTPCAVYGLQGTVPGGINPAGLIAGYVIDASNVYHIFLREPDGRFTTFEAPDAGTGVYQGTFYSFPDGLSTSGAVTGFVIDAAYGDHGFVRTPDGNVTTFDFPGVGIQATYGWSVNAKSEVTGQYIDANGASHGYLRTANGEFLSFDAPWAVIGPNLGTIPEANNDAGVITGNYMDDNGANHGFVRTPNGKFVTFDAPGAGTASGQGTIPLDINPLGAITGYYIDGNGASHGFARAPDCN